jgi:hypothetical protein
VRPGSLGLAAALASLVWSAAAGQQPIRNPHGKLQEECAVCHSSEAWTPARVSAQFDHAKKGFALAGAHAQAACRSCHVSLDFRGASSTCASCHKDIHRGELGNDCSRCHTPRNFLDRSRMVGAHQLTRFPLGGAHLMIECETCHTPAPEGRLTFVNVSTQCVDCHRPLYLAAKTPDHVAAGFALTCNECHAPTIWTAARFNHDASGFPLTGRHRVLTCQQCHGATGFTAITVTTCMSCHQQNFNATTNPSHAGAGFATTCQDCHTTTGWIPAPGFNHTWFSVPHHTAQCNDCHNVSSNFATFVCTVCHTQAQTSPRHATIPGYVWNSASCYGCHHR